MMTVSQALPFGKAELKTEIFCLFFFLPNKANLHCVRETST